VGNPNSYDLTDFIREMTAVVEMYSEAVVRASEAEKLVGKLVYSKSWLPPNKQIPDSNHYARYSLYLDPQDRFELIALVWLPGQVTFLHDHDGTWGVEGVLCGRMKVTNFLQIEKHSNDIVKLFHTGTMTVGAQSTSQLLPPADCHILEAAGEQPTITIHVYGRKLCKFRVFKQIEIENLYATHLHEVDYTSA